MFLIVPIGLRARAAALMWKDSLSSTVAYLIIPLAQTPSHRLDFRVNEHYPPTTVDTPTSRCEFHLQLLTYDFQEPLLCAAGGFSPQSWLVDG